MTKPSFTASRVGVACQAAGKKLIAAARAPGARRSRSPGRLKLDPNGGTIQGGPALAPGQFWTGIGLICNEKDRVLHCVVKGTERGFFVDSSGFVKAPPHTRR